MGAGTPILATIVVALGVFYQFALQPFMYNRLGVGRPVVLINNQQCERITELQSCEDAWYHQPSGLLYLGCSTPAEKYNWLPNADHFDTDKITDVDYIAILDTKASGPASGRITRVVPQGFAGYNGKGSLMNHGIGVYYGKDGMGESGAEDDHDTLRLFLINHRPQPDAAKVGANSTVELFETKLGSSTMKHIHTFADAHIFTPNNLVPSGPQSFYFSNDHSVKLGLGKQLDFLLPGARIGHCDVETGCKFVTGKIMYPNGLAGARNYPSKQANVVYKASSAEEYVEVYEAQADSGLVLTDKVRTGFISDNINMAADGSLVVAGFPKALQMVKILKTKGTTDVAPSAVVRMSKNTGKDAFYGQKWNVETLFEDDGHVVSGATNAQLDTERNLLFISGILTPYVAVCKIPAPK